MSSDEQLIVLFLPGLRAGGTERIVTSMASVWCEQKRRVQILLLEGATEHFFHFDKPIPVTSLDAYRGTSILDRIAFFKNILALRRALRALRPNTVASFLTGPNVLSILAAIGLPVRTVISERNNIQKRPLPIFWSCLRRITYRFSDLVTYNFKGNEPILEIYVPRRKLRYLPNPITVPNIEISSKQRRNTILSIGRLAFQKGYDILIPAFANSRGPERGWNLVIVGNGEEKVSLVNKITSYDMEGAITILDPNPEIWSEYLDCQYFILPSRFEGMPNALLEAIGYGLTPLISDMVGDLVTPIQQLDPKLVHTAANEPSIVDQLNWATDPLNSDQFISPSDCRKLLAPHDLKQSLPEWNSIFFPQH